MPSDLSPADGPGYAALTDAQALVARRVLAEESARREHVVVYLSGAHAYGFPSPDSDLDLKAVHIAPTARLLGLAPPAPTVDRSGFVEGVEVDYTSNELGLALAGILKGSGNYVERVLGALWLQGSALTGELAALTRGSLSRRVHRHYRGFAENQRRFLERERTAKKLLYVMRTALTGAHLLRSGEVVVDLPTLLAEYGPREAMALIELKRAGEGAALPDEVFERWSSALGGLFERLDDAHARSPLPEAPRNERELDAWLVDVRRRRL